MIAELLPAGSRAWVLVGHPCEHEYVEVVVGEPFELLGDATG